MKQYEAVIIGGGPAGLSALRVLRAAGIRNLICLERDPEVGGVPRHCHHRGFGLRQFRWPYTGPDYVRRLQAGLSQLETSARTTVVALRPGGEIDISRPDGISTIAARAVMIATGIRETPRAARLVSGERPAGILTTGALQQFVYLGGRSPCRHPVIVGTEWVSFSALQTLHSVGVKAVAVLEERPRISVPWPVDLVARTFFRVPVWTRARLLRINGRDRVESVEVEHDGQRRVIQCDAVIFTGQFVPEAALAMDSHLEMDPATGGPVIDQHWRCSDPAYFAAGNVLRPVETSGVCAREGEAAARAIVSHLFNRLAVPISRVRIRSEGHLRYLLPQVISLTGQAKAVVRLRGQVSSAVKGKLTVYRNGQEILVRRVSAVPERAVTFMHRELELDRLESLRAHLADLPAKHLLTRARASQPGDGETSE